MTLLKEVLGVPEPKVWAPKGLLKPKAPDACVNPTQVVGLEIETENCANYSDHYGEVLSKLWQVKEDGSLRGRAYEFISNPTEIGTLMAGELQDFYTKTGFTEANYTDRCSIHVHTNITDMTHQQVATLFLVYSVMEELLFEFVNHYNVADNRGHFRDTNIYCVPWNQCRLNHNLVKTMFSDATYTFRAWQKYTALNILPARSIGTVEWRHMHGSADVEKINKWLNIIGAIMKYAKEKDFDYVVKTIKELNDTSAYRQFYLDVLAGILPFDPKYETAISSGVVNAKYALIGLKDNKPVIKTKAKKETVAVDEGRWEDMININNIAAYADAVRNPVPVAEQDIPAPVGLAGLAREQAARPVRPAARGMPAAMNEHRRLMRERRYEELLRLAPSHRRLNWPLTAGVYTRAYNGDLTNAVQDALGNVRDMAGTVLNDGRFDSVNRYCKGLGSDYWKTVVPEYRPNDQYLWPEDYRQTYLNGEVEGEAA